MKKHAAVFLFLHFSLVSKRKDLKSRYFALIVLQLDSPFNLTSKDMYNIS